MRAEVARFVTSSPAGAPSSPSLLPAASAASAAIPKAHSEGGEGDGSGGGGTAAAVVGVGRARERVGPGKWRRVATLARWEPSARAHMLSHLEGATADVTGD